MFRLLIFFADKNGVIILKVSLFKVLVHSLSLLCVFQKCLYREKNLNIIFNFVFTLCLFNMKTTITENIIWS